MSEQLERRIAHYGDMLLLNEAISALREIIKGEFGTTNVRKIQAVCAGTYWDTAAQLLATFDGRGKG